MIKEKYIEVRKSTRTGHENEINAFAVYIPLPDGGKYYKNFKVRDYKTENAYLKAAIKDRDIHLAELLKGELVSKNSVPTVDQLYAKVPALRPRRLETYHKYDKIYERWIKPKYGNKKITDIKKSDVAGVLMDATKTCGYKHISDIKTVWKYIFSVAIDDLDLKIKDCSKVEMPPCDKVTERSLSEQNISQKDFESFCSLLSEYGHYLPKEEDKIYFRTIVLMILLTNRILGLRPMEIKALKRNDIQFMLLHYLDAEAGEERTVNGVRVTVNKAIGSTTNELLTVRSPKNAHTSRYAYGGEDCAELFRQAMEYSKYDLIFADYNGNPIAADTLSDYIYRVKKAWYKQTGNTADVYMEVTRKSFSADNYENAVNPATIKKLMGHATEDMSLNWYASSSNQDAINAALNRKYKK